MATGHVDREDPIPLVDPYVGRHVDARYAELIGVDSAAEHFVALAVARFKDRFLVGEWFPCPGRHGKRT